ncbi:hypothetical protein AB0F46_29630 [Streptomyces sp. NPDC026665]|uniref:hypothetical protein n=1 Tax=Streptomyces sp. NPDC026665 TaxID=3154798 RepID=UPI0033E9367D
MAAEIHPAVSRLLDSFRIDHLPAHLQAASRPFRDLAQQLASTLTEPEVTRALERLWDSKNWAVLAAASSSLEEAPAPGTPREGGA